MKTRTPFPPPGCIAASWLHGEMSCLPIEYCCGVGIQGILPKHRKVVAEVCCL